MANVPQWHMVHGKLDAVAPGQALVKITKDDDNDLPYGPCRALHVGIAGTATFIDLYGNECVDFPLVAGPNPYGIRRLKTGGTADDIWAVY